MKKACEKCGKVVDRKGNTWRFCSRKCWYQVLTFSRETAIEKFWEKVKKTDGCWIWKGTKLVRGGYGAVKWNGKITVKAHRVAWDIAHGEMPPPERKVLHNCDNPLCVRPDHLRLGSDRDNVQDTWERGRAGKPPRARMTMEIAAEIRRLYADGMSQKQLAKQFGMHQSNISYIVRRKTWFVHTS